MAKRTVDAARTISVATPEDLDKLLEWVERRRSPHAPAQLEGEHLFAPERLVVSPAAGVFTPIGGIARTAAMIAVGDVLGHVGDARGALAVRRRRCRATSPSTGERVTSRQPIAWLRTV